MSACCSIDSISESRQRNDLSLTCYKVARSNSKNHLTVNHFESFHWIIFIKRQKPEAAILIQIHTMGESNNKRTYFF